MQDDSMAFGEIRQAAARELNRWSTTQSGRWVPCVWQLRRAAIHVAPYCNVLSHLQALDDLLRLGTWCDEVELWAAMDDSEEAEMVFRYYGTAFLVWQEIVADLRLIQGAALHGEQRSCRIDSTHEVMGYINHVWKHRGSPNSGAGEFHRSHHHGPYVFADVPGHRTALPDDGAFVAPGHTSTASRSGSVPLVIPSLVSSIASLGRALRETSSILNSVAERQRVIDVYGSKRL